MWKEAIARMPVILFTIFEIIKSYTGSLIKLSGSNLFRQYFIEKNIVKWGKGRKFERRGW